MLQHEQKAWEAGYQNIAGVDEAGRGPLAGPVVAAAVWIDRNFLEANTRSFFKGLTDSKQLTPERREFFFEKFWGHSSIKIGLGEANVNEIDTHNILRATHIAMNRALASLIPYIDHILVDGLPVPGLACSSTAIVQGDGKSYSIAAASVIAKVSRDRMMVELDKEYPDYGFARHKGYGTSEHLEAIDKFGPCPCHRKSFNPVSQLKLKL